MKHEPDFLHNIEFKMNIYRAKIFLILFSLISMLLAAQSMASQYSNHAILVLLLGTIGIIAELVDRRHAGYPGLLLTIAVMSIIARIYFSEEKITFELLSLPVFAILSCFISFSIAPTNGVDQGFLQLLNKYILFIYIIPPWLVAIKMYFMHCPISENCDLGRFIAGGGAFVMASILTFTWLTLHMRERNAERRRV